MFHSRFSLAVRSLFPRTPRRRRGAKSVLARTSLERLETRTLMTATALLDFTGGVVSAQDLVDYNRGGLGPAPAVLTSAFSQVFNASNLFLDFDGNNRVDGADANIAIDRIVAKVRQHYSPYVLDIVVGELDQQRSLLTDNQQGDVVVMVTGNEDRDLWSIPFLDGIDFLGVAPHVDSSDFLGGDDNDDDEVVFAMGETIAGETNNRDVFVSLMAKAISHEMGHAFGLFHISTAAAGHNDDTLSHHMMADQNERDDAHDVVFQDIPYVADVPGRGAEGDVILYQNAHAHLNQVFGATNGQWAAVLKPGELTIQTATDPRAVVNTVNVTPGGDGWILNQSQMLETPDSHVQITTTAQFDTVNPGIDSINPYDAPLTRVTVNGSSTVDNIRFDRNFNVDVYAYGHGANDRIETGAGNDHVFGGDGADTLITNGGNDFLAGYLGITTLTDNDRDTLIGGTGRDTYVQHRILTFSLSQRRFISSYLEDSISRYETIVSTIQTGTLVRFVR